MNTRQSDKMMKTLIEIENKISNPRPIDSKNISKTTETTTKKTLKKLNLNKIDEVLKLRNKHLKNYQECLMKPETKLFVSFFLKSFDPIDRDI